MSKKIKVGVFLVGGIVLFCVGLFLIGSRQQLFTHHFVVYTDFNNIDTLQTGAKVRVSGMDAGEITGIQVPNGPSSKFRLELKIDQKFHPIVREDSLASIEAAGMVGNKFVNVKKGSDHSPECPAGCTLPSEEAVEVGELMRERSQLAKTMQATIEDMRHRADSAIDNVTSLTGHADQTIVAVSPDIEKIGSNSVHMTNNANAIVAGIRHGDGAAGKLLTDKKVASNVDSTIANAKQATANLEQTSQKADAIVSDVQRTDLVEVDKTLENTQDMTQQLDQAVGTFLSPGNNNQSTAVALRGAVQGAQQTTTNLADDTEAVKHNFFLRGFFKRRGFYNLDSLTPSKYASSELRNRMLASGSRRQDFSTLAPAAPNNYRMWVALYWISPCPTWFLFCRTTRS